MKKLSGIQAAIAFVAIAAASFVMVPDASRQFGSGNAPAGFERGEGSAVVEQAWSPTTFEEGIVNHPIRLKDLPVASGEPQLAPSRTPRRYPRAPISDEAMARLREQAKRLPYSAAIQNLEEGDLSFSPTASQLTEAINGGCSACASTPPDPEMAAGPSHLIVVVNSAFAIYNKATGALLAGPTSFNTFFNGTGCSGTFDPNVLYDESTDRFILGIDGNGTRYCIAATQTGNPTGTWNRYSFATTTNRRDFFDYPHAGVGRDAIYMGANIFRGQNFREGRAWAINKTQLYSGAALTVVSQTTGGDSTPQPANLHGWNQGTWPTSGPHYILTDDLYNGATYGVFSWTNPFSGGAFTKTGNFNLNTATGVTAGQPVNAPQQGGSNLQANDWRVQDADYRNGFLWMSNTISCNPGSGTVNCVRWAQVNPATRVVANAGVFASNGIHRTFADVAANHCNDMAVGYTRTSSTSFASVWVTGRQAGDAAGTVQAEVVCRNGDGTYTSFDSVPYRWGDYTEMTIDPNGSDFWYVGEFSKPSGTGPAKWATTICKVSFPCTP